MIKKKQKEAVIVDIAIPADKRIAEKEHEKKENYQDLKWELKRLWKLKTVQVVPIVIGTLGCVKKELKKSLKKINIEQRVEVLLKTALLGSARILRKVFES